MHYLRTEMKFGFLREKGKLRGYNFDVMNGRVEFYFHKTTMEVFEN